MEKKYSVSFQNEAKQSIENQYDKLTHVEQSVADFFIENKQEGDFSSKNVARLLYVSEATLSRFAKKCGYKGYREFIYVYEKDLEFERASVKKEKDVELFTKKVKESLAQVDIILADHFIVTERTFLSMKSSSMLSL